MHTCSLMRSAPGRSGVLPERPVGRVAALLAVTIVLLTGCAKPSVDIACRDYVQGVFEDEALAIDAVDRLADGYEGDGVDGERLDWSIAGLAYLLKIRVLLSGELAPRTSGPDADYFVFGLLELCSERIDPTT